MALKLGWRANDIRESYWKGDPAFKNIDAKALEDWQEDGDASHLERFATPGDPPTKITWRNLTPDEARVAQGYFIEATTFEGYMRAVLVCFRMAVGFPDTPEVRTEDGKRSYTVREKGIRMLANEFVTDIETKYPGIVAFYGGLILNASFASEIEKKASSPQSTPTPSSEAASTPVTTDPSPPVEGA
jgi:hypothetical protein